jgi:DNA-binding transcriptional ArsR family regulator
MSNEIEKSVLAMLYEGADGPLCISERMFLYQKNKIVFSALKRLKENGKKPDLLMLNSYLVNQKLSGEVGPDYIASISSMIPSTVNSQHYFDQFLEAYRRRELKRAATAMLERAEDKSVTAENVEKFIQDELQGIDKNLAATKPVALRSFADICRTDYEPLQWVVPGVIPEGVTLLFAPPKKGKSILATHLVDAVASGGIAFGGIPVKRRDVLYLALEDNERRIKDRLLRQGSAWPDNAFCITAKDWGGGGIAELDRYKKARPSIELIIIDTLGIFTPSEDSNAYSENYKIVSAIHRWSVKNDTSVILVHHSRKGSNRNEGESWQDEAMGSQGTSGGVDTLVFLHKKDTAQEGTLRIQGRDIEPTHKRIVFDNDLLCWRILGDAAAPVERETPERREIIDLLRGEGREMKLSEIAVALGKAPQTISNRLSKLNVEGKVKKCGYGLWALSEDSSLERNGESESGETSESSGVEAKTPANEVSPLSPPLRENESDESCPPVSTSTPVENSAVSTSFSGQPDLIPQDPAADDMPPGYGGRYFRIYSDLMSRGIPHKEADRRAVEQVKQECQASLAPSPEAVPAEVEEFDIW